jgi:hypothetical protein
MRLECKAVLALGALSAALLLVRPGTAAMRPDAKSLDAIRQSVAAAREVKMKTVSGTWTVSGASVEENGVRLPAPKAKKPPRAALIQTSGVKTPEPQPVWVPWEDLKELSVPDRSTTRVVVSALAGGVVVGGGAAVMAAGAYGPEIDIVGQAVAIGFVIGATAGGLAASFGPDWKQVYP